MTNKVNTLHGVFIKVFDCGVLLTGKSGIGKSEVALGLIDRGHSLIADDIVEIQRQDNIIVARCPEMLQDLLEIRGLGVLNIKQLFSAKAISPAHTLDLIVKLVVYDDAIWPQVDRLNGTYTVEHICECAIPSVTIPVTPGRSLSILVETAVRNHILRLTGEISSQLLIERQEKILKHVSGNDRQ